MGAIAGACSPQSTDGVGVRRGSGGAKGDWRCQGSGVLVWFVTLRGRCKGPYEAGLVPASKCVGPSESMQGGGVWRACGTYVLLRLVQCADARTPWQVQYTPLTIASVHGHIDVVRVLVDSKADMEARDQVAMWPVHPGAILLVVVLMQSRLGQVMGDAVRGQEA